MEEVKAGLVRGRHEMPVDTYIFNEDIKDVFNYQAMEEEIVKFLQSNVGITVMYGQGVNQHDYTDVEVYTGTKRLVLYVTGLTAVTAAVIKVCALNGIHLQLMHFDRESGCYVEQIIF